MTLRAEWVPSVRRDDFSDRTLLRYELRRIALARIGYLLVGGVVTGASRVI